MVEPFRRPDYPPSVFGVPPHVWVYRHICQEVCPWNQRFAEVAAERDYAARDAWEAEWDADAAEDEAHPDAVIPTTDCPSLVDLMKMDEDEWDAFTRGSAMRRAGYAGLRRNVAVALGNSLAASDMSDGEALGVLLGALEDEDRVVAETAAWALRRVGRQDARRLP